MLLACGSSHSCSFYIAVCQFYFSVLFTCLQVYPLSQAAEAQSDLAGRRTTGKLLLRPDYLL
jgi:hypothetical protein